MSLRFTRTLFTVLIAVLTFVALSATSQGQTFRGGINGTVADPSGAVVPGASVTAVETGTNTVYKAVSSSAGEFVLANLPVGTYLVTVSAPGFTTEKVSGVAVTAATSYVLPIKLSVAGTAQTVEVTANELTLDTVSDEQANAIPEQEVQSLPNSNRDFTQMMAQNTGFAGESSGGGALFSSVDGTRSNSINWQIEGTDNNDLWWGIDAVNQSGINGIAAVLLPIDAIENFSFVSAGTAEIGHSTGGTANVTIKSGTNSIHGSGYYNNHNEFFQVNNPFSGKEETRDQHYGFTAGGPIIKNKTFIFIGFEKEWFDIGAGASGTEPSAAYQTEALAVLNAYGVAENTVSKNLLNGNGTLSALWPAAALTGPAQPDNYASTGLITGYSYNGIGKIDENFTDKDHLAFTYFIGQGIQTAPLNSKLPPYFQQAGTHIQNYSLVYNRAFSPSMTNQLGAGVSYFQQVFADADNAFDPVGLGLETGVTDPGLGGAPNLVIGPPSSAGALIASSAGFDPLGPTAPEGRTDITGHLDEDLNWTKGAHQLHFGGEIRKAQVHEFYLTGERGLLTFDGTQGPWSALIGGKPSTACGNLATTTPSAATTAALTAEVTADPNIDYLADYLAGCYDPADTSIVEGNPRRLVYVNTFSVYGQDSYKLTRKLSLNYGLRYDYEGPVHTGQPNLSIFDPSITTGTTPGLAVVGQDVANIYPRFWNGWSPRVGFSYQVGSRGTTVLRGGYGLYNDSIYMKSILQDTALTNGAPVFGPQANPAGNEQVVTAAANDAVISSQPIYPTYQQALTGQSGTTAISTFDKNFRPDYMQSYNLNVQQSFGPSVVWQVGYVGTKGTHLLSIVDINQAPAGSVSSEIGLQASRPYYSQFPNFGPINEERSNLGSHYNSLQTSVRLQNWHKLAGSAGYTWGHALDYETGQLPLLPQNSFDEAAEYGNSDWDVRQTLTGTLDYNVPTFGRPGRLTKGWELDSGFYFHSGLPYTMSSSSNPSGNGEGADRAVQIADPAAGISRALVPATATSGAYVQWFNPNAFVDCDSPGGPQCTYSPTRRGQNYGPGYGALDLALLKSTQIRESVSLQFRADMFNLFNRTNLALVGLPTTNVSSGGVITSTIGAFMGNPGVGPGEPFNALFSVKLLF